MGIFVDTNAFIDFSNKQQISKKCPNCEAEFTIDLFCKTLNKKEASLTSQQCKNINSIIPFLNKYRKDYGLDTCLRKAHFIAQVAHETDGFERMDENEAYRAERLNKFRNFSQAAKTIDYTIVTSLKEHLSSIFRFIDKDNKELVKSNEEIARILLQEKPLIVDCNLYGIYNGGDRYIGSVYKVDKSLLYKIYIKNHSFFGVPLMSRAYAPYSGDSRGLGNGDELTRDGWKFKGRGLFHLTGRANYSAFSGYRNSHPFLDDKEEINFTEGSPDLCEGKYMMISSEAKYAVQSALWFWNKGKSKNYADIDDVKSVSMTINRYDTGSFSSRASYYERAKQAFKIELHKKFLEI